MDRPSHGVIRIGDCTLDLDALQLMRVGTPVHVRARTFGVLRHLALNPGRVISKDELFDTLWSGVTVTEGTLTQSIRELRMALGPDGSRALRTVPRRGYVLDVGPIGAREIKEVPTPARHMSVAPILAVLPFENFSREPRWDRLCDGLVEDMITDFSRHPDLLVIARTSSFAWRGKATDVREIGRALGADYLLEGSIQAEVGKVTVTAQLVTTQAGAHLWANRYVQTEEEIFSVQADVVGRVVAAVAGFSGVIPRAVLSRARRTPATLHAYELYLGGYEQEARLDKEGTLLGIEFLERALEADPSLSRAWTVLGFALANAVSNGWAEDPDAFRERQRDAIRRAVDLDPADGVALEELGAMLARQGDPEGARQAFERAAEAGANHADTLALLGKYMVEVLDRAGDAVSMMRRAFLLNPLAPPWYHLGATRVAYFSADFEEAVWQSQRAPKLRVPQLFRVLALAQLDRVAAAQVASQQYLAQFGPNGVTGALSALPPLCPSAQALLTEGICKAGLEG